ncbi:MAG: foldase protein PrsA [Candidatus Anammoxibacter sp.]
MNKRNFVAVIITVLLIFTITSNVNAGPKTSKPTNGNDIVAEINGQKITRKQFGDFLIDAYGDVAMDFLVKKKVVEQEAKKQNVKVTQKEMDDRLEKSANAQIMVMMQQRGMKTTEDLELELFNQGITLDKLRKNIIKSIRNQAEIELVVEKILLKDITYTEDELKEAYDDRFGPKIYAKQIVLKTRKKAEEVLMKLGSGAEFDKLAQKDSIDRASAARGGKMMPFSENSTLGRAVKSLKKNQFSDIVETGYGYHILQLVDRTPGSDKKFDEVRDILEALVEKEKLSQEVQPWLRSLFESAEVEILM